MADHLVLLVEDNEVNRDMLVRRLQRAGHRVVTAGDGEACLLYTSPSPRDKRQSRMPSSA